MKWFDRAPCVRSVGRRCRWAVLGFAGLFLAAALCRGEAALVPAGGYEAAAAREIHGARESVHLFLYLINAPADSAPGRLLEALIDARRRGVAVEVLLDAGASPFNPQDRNRAAADRLARGGVPVAYVDGQVLHAKALVVDQKSILLGSSNWTEAAFKRNAEADVALASPAAARSLLARMAALPRRLPPDEIPGARVEVPAAFLFPPDKLGEMVRRKDQGALSLYLHLLRRGISTESFSPLNVSQAVAALNAKDEGPTANRRRLHKIFRRLTEVYALADFQEAYGQVPQARLRPFAGVTVLSSGTLSLPEAWFDWGWDRRLSMPGKMFYVLHRYYADRSAAAPRWSLSRDTLARRHGLTLDTISRGVADLRRNNLIEVDYDAQPTPQDPRRRPNIYAPAPLYDPADLERRFASLERAHGPEALARARTIARLLYEDNDAGIVENLIVLERRYGRDVMADAARLLGRKQPDNPKRRFPYFAGLAKALAGPAREETAP